VKNVNHNSGGIASDLARIIANLNRITENLDDADIAIATKNFAAQNAAQDREDVIQHEEKRMVSIAFIELISS
jgi:ABC-type metal ion transport system substrate-binding protein